jgi:hypothetical protein
MFSSAKLSKANFEKYLKSARYLELNAYFSKLTWNSDARRNVERFLEEAVAEQEGSRYEFRLIAPPKEHTSNLTLHVFSPFQSAMHSDQASSFEKPAALHYALTDNGSVFVTIYPHSSSGGHLDESSFVIDIFRSANELAGAAGRSHVRRHLKHLLKLSLVSSIYYIPDQRSGMYISTLSRKTDKFSRTFENARARLKASFAMEVALGTGLIAGLLSSSIALLLQFGTDERKKVTEIITSCNKNAASIRTCFSVSDYDLHQRAAQYFTTPWLLLGIWSLVALCLMTLRRKQRKG